MKLTPLTRGLVRVLSQASGCVNVFTVMRQSRIGPGQIFIGLQDLAKANIVKFDGWNASLTPEGRKWLIHNRIEFHELGQRQWRLCPAEFVQPRRGSNEPYTPSVEMVDPELLPMRLRKATDLEK